MRVCGLVLLGGIGACGVVQADEITVVSPDYWCPFSCRAGAAREGFTIDIIRAIFREHGDSVRLVNENYSRALLQVRQGTYTATPSTLKEEAPDFVFPDLPISRNRFCFFVHASDNWVYNGPQSLASRRVEIIQNYSYGAELDRYIQAHSARFYVHTGNNLAERMIRLVDAKRFDTLIEEEHLISFTLKSMPAVQLRNAGCEKATYAYMGISPRHPQAREYARRFSVGMARLRKSGELAAILAPYGIEPW